MILPQLVLLAEELEGKAEIIKFECNKANKELGMKVGAGRWLVGAGRLQGP